MGTLSGNFSAGFIYHIMSGAEETPNVTSLAFGTPVVQPDRPFGSIISSCLRRLHVWCTLRWPFGCKKRSVVRIASTMYPTKAFIYLFIYIYIIFIFFIFQHCYNIDIHFVSWYVLSYILSYQSYFLSYLAIIPSYDQKISGYGDWDVQIIIYILCCALPLCKNGSSIWVSILHWPRSCQIISYEKWCWEVTFHGWSLNSELFIAFSSDHQFFQCKFHGDVHKRRHAIWYAFLVPSYELRCRNFALIAPSKYVLNTLFPCRCAPEYMPRHTCCAPLEFHFESNFLPSRNALRFKQYKKHRMY